MSQPTVCAIMLVNGRPEMVRRAIASFRAQTYEAKRLFILDTGEVEVPVMQEDGVYQEYMPKARAATIGWLRNEANSYALSGMLNCDVIVHTDSDDWSHPRRIEEQVTLLQASGKECVGYREVIFWQHRPIEDDGEAWLYTNNDPRYCIGASLCYWRAAWERRPFKDLPKGASTGEDVEWLYEIDSQGVSAGLHGNPFPEDPRLICSIHASNTRDYSDIAVNGSNNWKRVAEWDAHARKVMQL
jgi:glycosyltransferase involved in cell wall biosynthesis